MENNQTDLDSIFQALADPTRRAVVQRLGEGSATVSELAAPFQMGLPAFLKHIAVLEAAGLVTSIKVGRVRTCTLEEDKLEAAAGWFQDQREQWKARYEQLDALLDTLKARKKT
ncbi:ArsR/SmtB family transcription factor [Pseudoroseicyclus tamaricis]|uniref:Helix-turn-helix transcriptional regulator n=1 Tax=Pseudoroseicyclus tamaricis TaxID=2705421 RepID=A0A6B2K3A3_9RHOB|nr:metalloregulator ArsR/SmtB family transcription factor [Pseudoroseicyclus tamaricis]NDV02282.1 helix-turn-helix transcriptional regulator [Pseudoroseicyclus tamaricis]